MQDTHPSNAMTSETFDEAKAPAATAVSLQELRIAEADAEALQRASH